MTADDIARLRALLQAATSQPWRTANGKRSASVVTDGPERCAIYVNADRYGDMECSVPRWQADATLIAAAVNALGPLLDEVERMRARQQELLATIVRVTNETPYPDEVKGWTDQRATMVAQIGTLRARVLELERRCSEQAMALDDVVPLPAFNITDDDIAAVIAASGKD